MTSIQMLLPLLWVRKGNRVPYGGSLSTKYRIEKVERFEGHGPCWIWIGARSTHKNPYGRVTIDGRGVQAHRAVWEEVVGPITPGMDLDHWVCFNSLCVNPAHLQEKVPDGHRYHGLKGRRR